MPPTHPVPSDSPQLDLFEHSGERMALNDLADALERDDRAAAAAAWRRLADEYPDHEHLAAAARLIDWLESEARFQPLLRADEAVAARAALVAAGVPAATEVLGRERSFGWMSRRWRRLAQQATGVPFARDAADGHAAALWLAGGHWREAAEAVQRIESWWRVPIALAWRVEAEWQAQGLDPTWPLLAELCWLAPARVPPLLQALADPLLKRRLRGFEADLDLDLATAPEACAWLPAWMAIEQPLLAEPLSTARTVGEGTAERGLRRVAALIRLERQGRHADRVTLRRELRELSPPLFAAYMKTR